MSFHYSYFVGQIIFNVIIFIHSPFFENHRYGPNSSPFVNTCFQFKTKCVQDFESDCKDCVSGPPYCEMCSIPRINCQIDETNFVGMISSNNEKICQQKCLEEEKCSFYTQYNNKSEDFPNACILLSSCDTKERLHMLGLLL